MTANTQITKREIEQGQIQEKRGLLASLASKFEMEPQQFLKTIQDTVMPKNATREEVCAFLMISKEYNLNPLLREIHAFPKKGGGIQTVVGVDGWAKIITNHPDFDGCDFSYEIGDSEKPYATTCTLYRKNCSHPISVTEYYDECKRDTEPWRTMPKRMLRHKSLMQCGRIAFGISGIMDEDEARDIREVQAEVVPQEQSLLTQGLHKPEPKKRGRPPMKTIDVEPPQNPAPESSADYANFPLSDASPDVPPAREPGGDDGLEMPIPIPRTNDLPPVLLRLASMHKLHGKKIDAELAKVGLMPFQILDLNMIAVQEDTMEKLKIIVGKLASQMSK